MPFTVTVSDNFHYRDDDGSYEKGEYETFDIAVSVCKTIVDEYLAGAYEPGMNSDELYKQYTTFGEDPWVTPIPEGKERFSAWSYAEVRCKDICDAT